LPSIGVITDSLRKGPETATGGRGSADNGPEDAANP
jgi:hypothetical protein